jgi:dihydrolipoamide dehydrogenase
MEHGEECACAMFKPNPYGLFSMPTLETPRLILRRIAMSDAKDIFAYSCDEEVARQCAKLLKKRGIDIHTSAKVLRLEKSGEGFNVFVEESGAETAYACDKVLAAVGRRAETEGLGLEKAGVTVEKKGIVVDENYETNVKGIFAIGDVTGHILLAHAASEEGKVCVERMAGRNVKANYDLVPNCVFT